MFKQDNLRHTVILSITETAFHNLWNHTTFLTAQ